MGYLAIRKRGGQKSQNRPEETQQPLPNSASFAEVPFSWDDAVWFRAHRERLPMEPFRINNGVFVSNAQCYFDYLEKEIAQGSSNPRYRTGAIQSELKRLREIFSEEVCGTS